MTSGSSNFNAFPENQLTTFRAVQAVLWQIEKQFKHWQLDGGKRSPVPVIIT